ncbi:MAG: hypothetical protein U0P30_18595 [Vicinamibacterales bacterium]
MTPVLMAAGLVLMAGAPGAQAPADLPTCYSVDPVGTVRRLALAGGVVAELRRENGLDPDAGDCHLKVTDATGRVVLDRGGFNVRVMPVTGTDLDGDGAPDAVFNVDTAGGNHCCWDTTVVSLKAPARVSAESEAALGFLFDESRRRYVAEEVLAFYELGPDMASSPTAVRFHRLGLAGFEDVTRDYCGQLLDPQASGGFALAQEWRAVSPARRRAAHDRTGDAYENEQTGLEAISLALQYHVWPAEGRRRIADHGVPRRASPRRASGWLTPWRRIVRSSTRSVEAHRRSRGNSVADLPADH